MQGDLPGKGAEDEHPLRARNRKASVLTSRPVVAILGAMARKSEWLQIRVTPAQKRAIRRLAEDRGQDMSGYVLRKVLPDSAFPFNQILWDLEAGREHAPRIQALGELLGDMGPATFDSGLEVYGDALDELPPFLQNHVAVMVEQAAARLNLPPPPWVHDVEPLTEPWFGRAEPDERFRLIRGAPAGFKRRNLFVDMSLSPESGTSSTEASETPSTLGRVFALLAQELASAGVQGELCRVGGSVMCLALGALDGEGGAHAFLRPTRIVHEAAGRVAAREGMPDGWLEEAVDVFLGPETSGSPYLELAHLRLFDAPPRYVLAMRAAGMARGAEMRDLKDVQYLLRHLEITNPGEALAVVESYFGEGHLPPRTARILRELFTGS